MACAFFFDCVICPLSFFIVWHRFNHFPVRDQAYRMFAHLPLILYIIWFWWVLSMNVFPFSSLSYLVAILVLHLFGFLLYSSSSFPALCRFPACRSSVASCLVFISCFSMFPHAFHFLPRPWFVHFPLTLYLFCSYSARFICFPPVGFVACHSFDMLRLAVFALVFLVLPSYRLVSFLVPVLERLACAAASLLLANLLRFLYVFLLLGLASQIESLPDPVIMRKACSASALLLVVLHLSLYMYLSPYWISRWPSCAFSIFFRFPPCLSCFFSGFLCFPGSWFLLHLSFRDFFYLVYLDAPL